MPKFEANMNYIPPSPPSSMKQCNKSATVKFHIELRPGSNLAVVQHLQENNCAKVFLKTIQKYRKYGPDNPDGRTHVLTHATTHKRAQARKYTAQTLSFAHGKRA